ncbi:MAG TPA: NAD(P)-dependent oxidoreductase [Devosia sp.]|nr:NAD(P)-dependent oxidoreductase [Devosia sp.]
MTRKILITGAAGNIGAKFAAHARKAGYELVLLDRDGGEGILAADLAVWDKKWAKQFKGVDTVLHFAASPSGSSTWDMVMGANIAATQNMLRAARDAKVRRVVFASTNQVVLGYRFDEAVTSVTTDLPPKPLSPYGISKLMGEEMGRAFAGETGISFIALRIGYFQRGENLPGPHMAIGVWGQSMWLSNRDMMHALVRSIEAEDVPFAIVNLVSNNPQMRWDLKHTRKVLGYKPKDGHAPVIDASVEAEDKKARKARILPGTWFNERYQTVIG